MRNKLLLLCFGNPSRLDDGLGPAFGLEVEKRALESVLVNSDYQLNLEDACLIPGHEAVVFVDASVSAPAPYSFERIQPYREMGFTSHILRPAELLEWARDLFGAEPAAG